MGCLDLFALNVSTCFACRFSIFGKSSPHSAHRSLEPKTRLTPCGSRPTLQIFVKTKARTSLALILTKNTPQVGLEPTTYRLTAGCSTIELLRNIFKTVIQLSLPQWWSLLQNLNLLALLARELLRNIFKTVIQLSLTPTEE